MKHATQLSRAGLQPHRSAFHLLPQEGDFCKSWLITTLNGVLSTRSSVKLNRRAYSRSQGAVWAYLTALGRRHLGKEIKCGWGRKNQIIAAMAGSRAGGWWTPAGMDLHSAHSQPAMAANKHEQNRPPTLSILSQHAFSKCRWYNNLIHRPKHQVCDTQTSKPTSTWFHLSKTSAKISWKSQLWQRVK